MVNVIGILTLETVPGLNRQRLNALTAALSRIGFPILWAMVASGKLPRPGATVDTRRHRPAAAGAPQPALRVLFRPRSSWGYSGRGALMALAFACEAVIIPGGL